MALSCGNPNNPCFFLGCDGKQRQNAVECRTERNQNQYYHENPYINSCMKYLPNYEKIDGERSRIKLEADQPVVPVPVYQDIFQRDKYLEKQKLEIYDTLLPRIYDQEATHDIPKLDITYKEKPLEFNTLKRVDKLVEVPVNVGYAPKFSSKWDIREVPRPVPKFYGEPEVITVDVPKIEIVDKPIEKEVIVDVKDKIVPKLYHIPQEVEVVKYKWEKKYHDIPIYKYIPKFDVELDCPNPLLVPYPQTKIVAEPPVYTRVSLLDKSLSSDQAGQPDESPVAAAYPFPTSQIGCNQRFDEHEFTNTNMDYIPCDQPDKGEQPKNHNFLSNLLSYFQDSKKKNKSCFKSGCMNIRQDEDDIVRLPYDPKTGYPLGMPQDFTEFFTKGLDDVKKQRDDTGFKEKKNDLKSAESKMSPLSLNTISTPPGCDLRPTIEYKGVINKNPEYAGNLEPISFKLHAIEVHQYIPMPDVDTPEFVKSMPSRSNHSEVKNKALEKLFGPVSSGWADPGVTGMPAPTMNDILKEVNKQSSRKNSQVSLNSDYANEPLTMDNNSFS